MKYVLKAKKGLVIGSDDPPTRQDSVNLIQNYEALLKALQESGYVPIHNSSVDQRNPYHFAASTDQFISSPDAYNSFLDKYVMSNKDRILPGGQRIVTDDGNKISTIDFVNATVTPDLPDQIVDRRILPQGVSTYREDSINGLNYYSVDENDNFQLRTIRREPPYGDNRDVRMIYDYSNIVNAINPPAPIVPEKPKEGNRIFFQYSPSANGKNRNNYINWGVGKGREALTQPQADSLYQEFQKSGRMKHLGETDQSNFKGTYIIPEMVDGGIIEGDEKIKSDQDKIAISKEYDKEHFKWMNDWYTHPATMARAATFMRNYYPDETGQQRINRSWQWLKSGLNYINWDDFRYFNVQAIEDKTGKREEGLRADLDGWGGRSWPDGRIVLLETDRHKSVPIHEFTHAMSLPSRPLDKSQSEIFKKHLSADEMSTIYNNLIRLNYDNDERLDAELYPRVNEYRYLKKMNPDHWWTPEDVDGFKSNFSGEIFRDIPSEKLLKILNELVQGPAKTNNGFPIAKKGAYVFKAKTGVVVDDPPSKYAPVESLADRVATQYQKPYESIPGRESLLIAKENASNYVRPAEIYPMKRKTIGERAENRDAYVLSNERWTDPVQQLFGVRDENGKLLNKGEIQVYDPQTKGLTDAAMLNAVGIMSLPFDVASISIPKSRMARQIENFNKALDGFTYIPKKKIHNLHELRQAYWSNDRVLDLDELDFLNKFGKGDSRYRKIGVYLEKSKFDIDNVKSKIPDFLEKTPKELEAMKLEHIKQYPYADHSYFDEAINIVKDEPVLNKNAMLSDLIGTQAFDKLVYEEGDLLRYQNRITKGVDNYIDDWFKDPETKRRFGIYNAGNRYDEMIKNIDYPSLMVQNVSPGAAGTNTASNRSYIKDALFDFNDPFQTGIHEKYHQSKIVNTSRNNSLLPELYDDIQSSMMTKEEADMMGINISSSNDIPNDYYIRPTEVYSRMGEMRSRLNKKPGDVITMDELNAQLGKYGSPGADIASAIKDKKKFLDIMNTAPIITLPVIGGASLYKFNNGTGKRISQRNSQ